MPRRPSIYDRPILAALAKGDMTGPEVTAAVGIGLRQVIERVLYSLRDRGQVHIALYRRSEDGPPKPIWRAGPGIDAKPSKKLTKAQVAKRHRDKLRRENPIEYKARVARNNLRHRTAKARPDIAASWIV